MDTGSPIWMADAKVVFALTGSKCSQPFLYAWYSGLAFAACRTHPLSAHDLPDHENRCGQTSQLFGAHHEGVTCVFHWQVPHPNLLSVQSPLQPHPLQQQLQLIAAHGTAK